jgi:hypothetical protein
MYFTEVQILGMLHVTTYMYVCHNNVIKYISYIRKTQEERTEILTLFSMAMFHLLILTKTKFLKIYLMQLVTVS